MGNYKGPAIAHSLLASVSLFVGFGCPSYFWIFDECDEKYDGYNIYRDFCDLYIPLIFIGFIHLGFFTGICKLKLVTNVVQHQGEIYKEKRFCKYILYKTTYKKTNIFLYYNFYIIQKF